MFKNKNLSKEAELVFAQLRKVSQCPSRISAETGLKFMSTVEALNELWAYCVAEPVANPGRPISVDAMNEHEPEDEWRVRYHSKEVRLKRERYLSEHGYA